MPNENFIEKDLDNEQGMFAIELANISPDLDLLLEASNVDKETKSQVKEVFSRLKTRVENARENNSVLENPGDIVRNALGALTHILKKENPEEDTLYEAIKGVLWKACYSVKGWKYPPPQI